MQNKEYDSLMFSLDPNSNPASPAPPELHVNTVFFAVQFFCIVLAKEVESSRLTSLRLGCKHHYFFCPFSSLPPSQC